MGAPFRPSLPSMSHNHDWSRTWGWLAAWDGSVVSRNGSHRGRGQQTAGPEIPHCIGKASIPARHNLHMGYLGRIGRRRRGNRRRCTRDSLSVSPLCHISRREDMFHFAAEIALGLFPHRYRICTIDLDIDRSRSTGEFRMGSECCCCTLHTDSGLESGGS